MRKIFNRIIINNNFLYKNKFNNNYLYNQKIHHVYSIEKPKRIIFSLKWNKDYTKYEIIHRKLI